MPHSLAPSTLHGPALTPLPLFDLSRTPPLTITAPTSERLPCLDSSKLNYCMYILSPWRGEGVVNHWLWIK